MPEIDKVQVSSCFIEISSSDTRNIAKTQKSMCVSQNRKFGYILGNFRRNFDGINRTSYFSLASHNVLLNKPLL